jgi:hypothetical protein
MNPVRAREAAVIAVWDALQIILVLGLGFPEIAYRRHVGFHFIARAHARRFHIRMAIEPWSLPW